MSKNILVFGATGPQGSGLVRALVKINSESAQPKYKILAVTRDPSSEKAQGLAASPNVDLRQWNDEDLEVLFKDQDLYGVFSLQTALQNQELKQANTITDLSVKYGIKHLIYNGLDHANTTEKDEVPGHLLNKRKIEQHIKASGLKWTIFKPTWFYENFYWPPIQDAILTILNNDRIYKMVSTDDIGRVVAEAFETPDKWVGREFDLGADGLKPQQIAAVWQEVTGQKLESEKAPEFPDVINQTWKFVNAHEYAANVEENRKEFPWIRDFKTWLQSTHFAKKA